MAFIAINAKADVAGSKKGKLSPAQNAQLNAWCLAKKTGILDCLDKCTATVQSVTNNEATIIFNRGYIVICGRLVECESGTMVKITTPSSGSTSGKIILRYSLIESGEDEFTVTTKNGDLTLQDLNDNPTNGIYEFELYSYTATPTEVTLTRNTEYVPDVGGLVKQIKENIENNITGAGKPLYNYNNSKGTIEERLTNLGFKEGTITATSYNTGSIVIVPENSFIRQLGKIIYGKLAISVKSGFITSQKNPVCTFSSIQNIDTEKEIIRYLLQTENSIDEKTATSTIILSLKNKYILLSTTTGQNIHFTGNQVFSFVVDLYKNDIIVSNAGTYPIR